MVESQTNSRRIAILSADRADPKCVLIPASANMSGFFIRIRVSNSLVLEAETREIY